MAVAQKPVTVDYTDHQGEKKSIDCELLVIACDPKPLFADGDDGPVLPPIGREKSVLGTLTDYVFQTTLVTVDVPDKVEDRPKFGAILDPAVARSMSGDLGAFRNESAKQYSLEVANTLPQNHLVLYQLWAPESKKPRPTSEALFKKLRDQLDTGAVPWWPYKSYRFDPTVPPLHSAYFHHWSSGQLQAGLPWDLLKLQGDNRTVYVWAGGCFESVLQCWQYQDLLLSPDAPNPIELPSSSSAPIVIIGAGVSGLLFADRLRRDYGYTNVTLIERNSTVGGKTHSVVRPEPRPSPEDDPTVCELGTCYVHPGYDELVSYLGPFVQGDATNEPNRLSGFVASSDDPAKEFRAMVTTGIVFDPVTKQQYEPSVVGYDEYLILRFQQEMGFVLDPKATVVLDVLGGLLIEYAAKARELIGSDLPMPFEQPTDDKLTKLSTLTFEKWLDKEPGLVLPLKGLKGVMEYAYSNQGYGPLGSIPLYYGMVWISAVLAERLVIRSVEDQPNVTVWSKGWGDVWRRMAEPFEQQNKVVLGATVTSINRPS